ncbi:MAG: murein hydrolase activator EnvC family protein [Desulfobulbaceae bacterium]
MMRAVAGRKALSCRFLAFFLMLGQPLPVLGAQPAQAEPAQQRKRYESSIQKLKSGIEIHLGRLQIAGQQEFDLLGEIERLDQELSLQKIRLDVMRERRDSQKQLLIVKLRELEEAKTNIVKVEAHLQVRLRAFYLTGKTGILNVTFSTRTLPDLMLFNDAFKRLLDYDRALVDTYRQAIDQLTLATEAHERESILLDEFIANALAQQQKLDGLLAEKRTLLKKAKTEKVLHEQALRELRKAEADLEQTLAALQQEKSFDEQGFVQEKGRMAPPARGTLLRRFGDIQDEKVINGIVIDAVNGAEITAIAAGRVLFSGYRRGYGNMVIIDHGMDYYTITARMEKIKSLPRNKVNPGDIIGYAGDTATLFDQGVYFEIRHGTEPEDPLKWLTMEGLTDSTALP